MASQAQAPAAGENPDSPVVLGFDATLASTSQHDSAAGWSNVLAPAVSWRFNRSFALSAGVPIFTYLYTSRTGGTALNPTTVYAVKNLLLGDTGFSAEYDAHPAWLDYTATATVSAPTGNTTYGLGAGQLTYSVVNHLEHPLGDWLTPNIELGIGDNPDLITGVRKSYLAIGTQAHFQAGTAISLPWYHMEFEADAYEEMPLSAQTVTSRTVKGKKGKLVSTKTSASAGEDNGFTTELDIPVLTHMSLTGFYNRSLRNHDDIAGFTLNFFLRPHPRPQDNPTQ